MNNIVFLDIDGVLNYTEWYICPRNKLKSDLDPFWKRVVIGIKYIFGYRSKYGEFIISKDNYKQFKEILTFFEDETK